jgi:hypothetical protein
VSIEQSCENGMYESRIIRLRAYASVKDDGIARMSEPIYSYYLESVCSFEFIIRKISKCHHLQLRSNGVEDSTRIRVGQRVINDRSEPETESVHTYVVCRAEAQVELVIAFD